MLRFNLAWPILALICMSNLAHARVCIRDLAGQIVCGEPIETRDEPSEQADPRQYDSRDRTPYRARPELDDTEPEPPCEPGKVRVIVRGNSQCRYPGEMRGGGVSRPYYDDPGPRGYGPEPPCEPGKRRVIIRGNSQCR